MELVVIGAWVSLVFLALGTIFTVVRANTYRGLSYTPSLVFWTIVVNVVMAWVILTLLQRW